LLRAFDAALGVRSIDNGESTRAAADLLRDALQQQRAGKTTLAIEKLREAVLLDPLSSQLRSQLAALLLKGGAVFEAIQELEEAADLDPTSITVLRSLALLYEKRGFGRKAFETWERALVVVTAPQEREEIRKRLVALL